MGYVNRDWWLAHRNTRPPRKKRLAPLNTSRARVPLGPYSKLRKLMRLARQGKIPDERMVIIQQAERLAAERVAPRRSDPIGQSSPGELDAPPEVS